jgi:hydrogenase maturation protease
VSEARVLVAGVGNVFLSDDGFGVAVAERLAGMDLPEGVEAADFGIRGVHLAYQLLDGYDTLVLVDALDLGSEPGTVAVFEPDLSAGEAPPAVDGHSLDPTAVLGTLRRLGGSVGRVLVVGCQPATVEEGMGLSPAVAAAVEPAAAEAVRLAAAAAVVPVDAGLRPDPVPAGLLPHPFHGGAE